MIKKIGFLLLTCLWLCVSGCNQEKAPSTAQPPYIPPKANEKLLETLQSERLTHPERLRCEFEYEVQPTDGDVETAKAALDLIQELQKHGGWQAVTPSRALEEYSVSVWSSESPPESIRLDWYESGPSWIEISNYGEKY